MSSRQGTFYPGPNRSEVPSASLETNPGRPALPRVYSRHSWLSPLARASASTKSSHQSAKAAWDRCIERRTRSSVARSRSRSCPTSFAADPERLARFEREAKTLASLNHPHIAAIYGFEKSAGMHALVMELVEGRRSPTANRDKARFQSTRHCLSRSRSPRRSKPRTSRASFIAT